MGIIGWLILGAIAGWIGSRLMGTRFPLLGNIVLGITGAILGGFINEFLLGGDGSMSLSLGSIVLAVIGSCITLFVAGKLGGSRQLPR